jgi:hypothetical protein
MERRPGAPCSTTNSRVQVRSEFTGPASIVIANRDGGPFLIPFGIREIIPHFHQPSARVCQSGARSWLGGAIGRAVRSLGRAPARQGVGVVLLLFGYYGMVRFHWITGYGGANYIASSTVFLSSFALCFYRPGGRFPKVGVILMIVVGALLLSWGVAALFSGPLRVPLP